MLHLLIKNPELQSFMDKESIHTHGKQAIALLQQLIATPSMSKDEGKAADLLQHFLSSKDIAVFRSGNNVWSTSKHFDAGKPSILLNSHLDTVPANTGYTRDPYAPVITDGKLFGLGSTDAGGALVSLASAFVYYYSEVLDYNLVFAATAEEEISGLNGIESLFASEHFQGCFNQPGSFGIVGEPTELQLCVAEKGLMVLDCVVTGKAGHAARDEGDNAIYKTVDILTWFKDFKFEKVSPLLGEVKMTVTSIRTENKAHNIVPAECSFVVDVRLTEMYTHDEVLAIIQGHVDCTVSPRSKRLKSSSIHPLHPVVQAGLKLGKKTFGSPTLSDQALIPLPCLKCGPGSSVQSHSADEFIFVDDVYKGVALYINLIGTINA